MAAEESASLWTIVATAPHLVDENEKYAEDLTASKLIYDHAKANIWLFI